MRARFGECELDAGSRRLLRGGADVPLSPKAFSLLALLVESRPRALSKAQLLEALWPDTFVSEVNLAVLVAEIRKAVGDSAKEGRLVRTVRRFGYAFDGPVEEIAETGALPSAGPLLCRVVVWGVRDYAFARGEVVVGRGRDVQIFIDSSTLSRRHARIGVSPGDAVLEDLGSKNGTFLNGARVEATSPLSDGDEIRVGSVFLSFHWISASGETRTATDAG